MLIPIKPKDRKITKVCREKNSLILEAEFGTLFLEPVSEYIVRVIYNLKGRKAKDDKIGVICKEEFSDWTYEENDTFITMTLPELVVCVKRDTGSVRCFDQEGKALFREREREPKEFEEFEMFRLSEEPQKTKIIETADGKKEVLEDPVKVSAGKSYHIRLHMELGEEALYGLGQQEKGFASLRGRTVYGHQANRKIAIPMFVSTSGYGVLFDTFSPFIFRDDYREGLTDEKSETCFYIEADQELKYYVIGGGMNRAVQGYRFLTGKAAMLPKWAFGYVQSKERYENQEEILAAAEKSRDLGIGMDCIVLDWFSWENGHWGQKSYEAARFPDPAGMIKKLHDMHVHFMISIWPTMAECTANHKEFVEKDPALLLPANTAYNPFRKEARELYFDQLRRTHYSYGTDAWWCDSSEPFTPEWNHLMRPEEVNLFREYCEESGLRMTLEKCNAFALYHAMGIYEGQRSADTDNGFNRRVCNLTRSASVGQQRFGTVMWSGDTDASWETYRNQIAIGLHFSASGLPYWTNDIGAFFVKKGINWYWDGHYENPTENPGYAELYTRWYQYAAFLPMFRAHGTEFDRELWNFGGVFYEAMLSANRLRYALMPYIYSEAGKVWLKDRSMIRFPAFDYSGDPKTWEITDQFLFGESLMVCPVTEPMYYDEEGNPLSGRTYTRKVYLPQGNDWYDFYTGEKYSGGSVIEADAPLERIPLYVKDGTCLPMQKENLSTEEQTDPIVWKRFGSSKTCYELYEDGGDGYGYESGEYTIRNICKEP